MIIIRLLFSVFIVFLLLMVSLGLSIWFKVRTHLQNPFLRQNAGRPMHRDDNVIEGDYKVLSEQTKD